MVSRVRRRVAVQFSMCVLLFVWPLYRASNITTTIHQDKLRNSDAFHPDNLDSVKYVPCGQYKCFFRAKSNDSIGYLVAPSERKKDTHYEWFSTLKSGWNLSQQLQEEYDIEHFLLEPPEKIKITKELDKRLNKHLFNEMKGRLIRGKNVKKYSRGSTAFVQKVKTAPKNSIVIGCADSKMDAFKKNINNFVKNIKYTESFAQNFKQGLATAKNILEKEPCLVKDFQVFVDEKGHIFHLDFDRCFVPDDSGAKYEISKEETKACLQSLDEIDRRLERSLHRQ